MGKHRYKHSSQTRPTCANPPAQGRCKYGKSFSNMCLLLQLPCHLGQNAFLGYKTGTLGISPFCCTEHDWCLQDRYKKKAPLCKKYIPAVVELDSWDDLPVTTKGQGQKTLKHEVPVLCPVHLLISL